MRLFVDLETKGDGDVLHRCGAAVYAEDATISDCCWAIDDGEICVGTLEELKPLVAQCDEFIAHNAFFDLSVLSKHGVRPKKDCLLGCTYSMCSFLNLPASLENAAPIILGEEKFKMPIGLFADIGEDMEAYVKQDVKLCRGIFNRLERMIPKHEFQVINAHLRTNLRGFKVNTLNMVGMAGTLDKKAKEAGIETAKIFKDANSPTKLKEWFVSRGHNIEGTGKVEIASFNFGEDKEAKRLAGLLGIARSPSVPKLNRLAECITNGDRLRGAYQYAGALTGRWSSRGVQMHNLQKAKDGLRSLFIAGKDCRLWVADFAQIELRVNLWLSGERNALNKLAEADLYQELADQIGCPRFTAKVVLLAAQYGVGKRTTAIRLQTTEDEAAGILKGIHDEIPGFRRFANSLQKAVTQAYRNHTELFVVADGQVSVIAFRTERGVRLDLRLPTGRSVILHDFHLDLENGFVMKARTGEKGDAQMTSSGVGKLVENVCSAIARDYLAQALVRLNNSDLCQVVGHVHDEAITEVRKQDCNEETKLELERLMLPEDNSDLPLAVESKFVDNWQQNND